MNEIQSEIIQYENKEYHENVAAEVKKNQQQTTVNQRFLKVSSI